MECIIFHRLDIAHRDEKEEGDSQDFLRIFGLRLFISPIIYSFIFLIARTLTDSYGHVFPTVPVQ